MLIAAIFIALLLMICINIPIAVALAMCGVIGLFLTEGADSLVTIALDMYDETENSALLESADRIERGTRRLQEANRVAIESEQIGADILSNLQKDREQINRTRARVR